MHFADGDIDAMAFQNIKTSFSKAEQSEGHPEAKQRAVIQAMVNMANINGAVADAKYQVIENKVAHSDLGDDEKLELLGHVGNADGSISDFSYDIDFDLLACDTDYALDALRSLADVAMVNGMQPTMAERMYLTMAAKALGLQKEVLDETIESALKNN